MVLSPFSREGPAIFNGGFVNWLGTKEDRILKVVPRYLILEDAKHINVDKARLVCQKIQNKQYPHLPCPYGKASSISIHDIALTQKAHAHNMLMELHGMNLPWTTGNPDIDAFLAHTTLDISVQEEASYISRIKNLEESDSGDLNSLKIELISGQDIALGAILAEEPHIFVRLESSLAPIVI